MTVKDLIKLTQKKHRREAGLCIVEGDKLVTEHKDKAVATFTRASTPHIASCDGQLSQKDFAAVTDLENSRGILAVVPIPKPSQVTFPYVVLDGIQDPGNVGTILRTCRAFGYKTIFCINCADVWSQKVIRSAMGMQFGLNIIEGFDGIPQGSELYIADMGKQVQNRPSGKFGIVFGNEGNGVSAEMRKLPHKIVSIPMKSDVESLNVAVACGIILHEWSQ
ncbi:MAG: RNA methyltransferase [Christensenellaceae bacterium]|jgi:TrmH family RNA methyltransferase|nr:RNA methyltransferase [Christensenellaceae bacterium]